MSASDSQLADHPNGSTPESSSPTNGEPAMSYALTGLAKRSRVGSEDGDSWTPSSSAAISDEEDGGRVQNGNDKRSKSADCLDPAGGVRIELASAGSFQDNNANIKKNNSRRRSVQVVIEKSASQGRYTLTTEDPEFQEALRGGIQREAERLSGKSRNRLRDLVFTRQFTTFDRQNPIGSQSPFHGFFTLFWLAMALLLIKIAAQNYKNQGSVFGNAEILHLMVDRDLLLMLVTDGLMTLSTVFGLLLHKAIAKGYLTWSRSGWVLQSLWQVFFTGGVIGLTFYRSWSWTHTVFIVLHVFVLLMKQHSYAFYNGYLSQVYRRRELLSLKLKQLEDMGAQDGSSQSPHPQTISSTGLEGPDRQDLLHRRRSASHRHSAGFKREGSGIAAMAKTIEAGEPLSQDQIEAFISLIKTEVIVLSDELRGKCSSVEKSYPNNLTLINWMDWTCLPTLVYEVEYPRQEHINWWYVAEKSAATIGVIWSMIVISQAYIYPVVVETVRQKEAGMTLEQRWLEFPWVMSDMMFPLLLEQLLAWYVIWECVLNVLAELTRFADRGFYGDWWNSVSWDQYARDWNRPVHNFLLRHVYHSSISAFHMSKMGATFFTFLLSAVVHEVLMLCLFKKVRGYLFAFQLSQLPLAWLSKTRLLKGRDTLGNLIFWIGLFIGPSLITSLYLIV